jgi:hypothetical protein
LVCSFRSCISSDVSTLLLQIIACYKNLDDSTCSIAQDICENNIGIRLSGNWDVFYVLTENPDRYPPDFTDYINSVNASIGAETIWGNSGDVIFSNFAKTGDLIKSTAPALEKVINAGIRTVLYDGDADYICNYMGVEAMVSVLLSTGFGRRYVVLSRYPILTPPCRRNTQPNHGRNGLSMVRLRVNTKMRVPFLTSAFTSEQSRCFFDP